MITGRSFLNSSVSKFTLILAAGLTVAPATQAADFTINNGQTVGAQVLSDPGDRGVINSGGTVSVNGAVIAIDMQSTDQVLENDGTISLTGVNGTAVRSSGDRATITNNGTMSIAADYAIGIRSSGADSIITNNGNIMALGEETDGIISQGANATITNNGTISTRRDYAVGIFSVGRNAMITNNGTISTRLDFTSGIRSFGKNARITNNGVISVASDEADGIRSVGTDARITNSGTISMEGYGSQGIFSSGADGQVVNSGTITALTSKSSKAIEFFGIQDNKLTLLPGSVIQGNVAMGGGTDTLVIGKGLSISVTFDKVPEVIDTQGAPFVIAGTTVTTTDGNDLGSLGTQVQQMTAVTGGVSLLLANRLSGLRGGFSRTGFSSQSTGSGLYQTASLDGGSEQLAAGGQAESDFSDSFWVQSFGSYRNTEADGNAPETRQWQGGLLAGMDQVFNDDILLGAFAGLSRGEAEVVEGTQESETRGFFAGVYGSIERSNLIFDLSVSAGYNLFEQEREINNSSVAGGIEKAEADYGGWFVSPEVVVTAPTELAGHAVEPSLSLRYAGLFVESYTETGVAAPLTIESRDLHVGIARLQLAAPNDFTFDNGDVLRTNVKAGAELRQRFGNDRIEATLVGQTFRFDTDEDDTTLGGYAGLSGEYDAGTGTVFFFSAEGLVETEGAYQISGQAGLKFKL